MPSVCYREGAPAISDYDEAIADLQAAKAQRESMARGEQQPGCSVCGDSGHTVESCHHDPLQLARLWSNSQSLWRCWHCGFEARTDAEAVEHFGAREDEVARCLRAAACSADDGWRPISELAEEGKYAQVAFDLFSPDLIDEDFNPTGVVEGYFQDDEGWQGAIWDGCHDVWNRETIHPTHYRLKAGPAIGGGTAVAAPCAASCRVCGCTDTDCSGCIERTGEPCHWVTPDLCSACVDVKVDIAAQSSVLASRA